MCVCVSTGASQHIWLAAAAAGGTCVSSDCRQLTVSLTSVFSKLYVISEADEGGGVMSRSQITALLSIVDFNRLLCDTHLVSTITAPFHKLDLGLLRRYSSHVSGVAAPEPSSFFVKSLLLQEHQSNASR